MPFSITLSILIFKQNMILVSKTLPLQRLQILWFLSSLLYLPVTSRIFVLFTLKLQLPCLYFWFPHRTEQILSQLLISCLNSTLNITWADSCTLFNWVWFLYLKLASVILFLTVVQLPSDFTAAVCPFSEVRSNKVQILCYLF